MPVILAFQAEAGGSQVGCQPGLCSETLSHKRIKKHVKKPGAYKVRYDLCLGSLVLILLIVIYCLESSFQIASTKFYSIASTKFYSKNLFWNKVKSQMAIFRNVQNICGFPLPTLKYRTLALGLKPRLFRDIPGTGTFSAR
jgi:hypothetical protein